MLPATVTVPPLAIFSVCPEKTLPTPLPENVRLAPLATTTVPPPVHAE